MNNKSIVIHAGGAGRRLRSITKNKIPKPLVKINNKPFLKILLDYLSKFNFYKIYIPFISIFCLPNHFKTLMMINSTTNIISLFQIR